RVGHIRAFTVFAALSAISVLLLALIPAPWVWAALRAVMGVSMAGLFLVAESWLQFRATNETRGRTFALYVIGYAIGAGSGPLLINLAEPARHELFVLASILFSVALLPVALTRVGNPELGESARFGLRELFAVSPVAVVGAFASGLASSAFSAMAPVYGERVGMAAIYISLLMTAMRLGGFVMQYPIGSVSDRFDRRRVVIALGVGAAVATTAVAATGGATPPVVLALACLYGAFSQPIYGLMVAHANDYVEPEAFVATSAGLLFAFGVGASAGPTAAAVAMDWLGPAGLFHYLAVVLLAFCAFVVYRMRRRAPLPTEEQGEFVAVPPSLPAAGSVLDPRAGPAEEETPAAEEDEIEREIERIRWN
ncbi:MAG: MFS transporter, partial [Alphaproteobacteria bacterium]